MSASRTLLNKRRGGRPIGPVAQMRRHMPVVRALRMATPHGSTPFNRLYSYVQHLQAAYAAHAQLKAEQTPA